jgi:hypothetical protein
MTAFQTVVRVTLEDVEFGPTVRREECKLCDGIQGKLQVHMLAHHGKRRYRAAL